MMTSLQQEKHDMIQALQARQRAEAAKDPERAGFIADAADQFGLVIDLDAEPHIVSGTLDQLIAFAVAAEAAGHFQYARRAGHTCAEALAILNKGAA